MKGIITIATIGIVAAVSCRGGALNEPVMQADSMMSAMEAYRQLVIADKAADEGWLNLKSRVEYDQKRKDLHAKMIEAVGGFPEKLPLNAVEKPSFEGHGYRVENVYFESHPGIYVTGNFYLPTDAKYQAPYPAVVVTCGHSNNGKGAKGYQRACVQLAQAGFAAFIYDPFEQGERISSVGLHHNTGGHNEIGVRAALLGWSMARFRIWDGIRAIDYVVSRPEVDAKRIGYMGQSGGGTMTSLMMAVDERIKCATPSCYLTNFRSLCLVDSPQDAEQNIFGQLAFGLNHLGYVLMQDIPICMVGRYADFFPFVGANDTYSAAKRVSAMLGEGDDHYAMAFQQGPHGWMESTRTASVAWFKYHLQGDKTQYPIDMAKYRQLDVGFSYDTSDNGVPEEKGWSAPGGCVENLPGAKDIYKFLEERLTAVEKERKGLDKEGLAAAAIRLAKIRMPAETKVKALVAKTGSEGETNVEAIAFMQPSGYMFPAVLMTPKAGVKAGTKPALLVGDNGRGEWVANAQELIIAGRAVLVADLFGYGEIGEKKFQFYRAEMTPEESAAVTLYLLGESAIGRQATDAIAAAEYLKGRFGGEVEIMARGSAVIGAAHAFAARRDLFESVRVGRTPKTWAEVLHSRGVFYPFANIVNGALLSYDWPELLK